MDNAGFSQVLLPQVMEMKGCWLVEVDERSEVLNFNLKVKKDSRLQTYKGSETFEYFLHTSL